MFVKNPEMEDYEGIEKNIEAFLLASRWKTAVGGVASEPNSHPGVGFSIHHHVRLDVRLRGVVLLQLLPPV